MELTTKGLSRSFPGFTFSADLTAKEGSLLCLLGPSGCGKTTALQLIAGIVEPDAGSIYLGGRDITRLPPWKRNLGLVFQDYARFPHLTVAGNVSYGLKHRGYSRSQIRSRVRELLELVHLPGYEQRDTSLLSGGEKQRVALARAVAPSPALLLLDEPLSALDAQLRARLRREIRGIQRRLGLTTVYVTHDQEEALTMSDRIAVLQGGRVEQNGPPRSIYREPRNTFVAGFLGGSNLVPLQRENNELRIDTVNARPQRIPAPSGTASADAEERQPRLFFRPENTRVQRSAPASNEVYAFRLPVAFVEYLGSHEVVEGSSNGTRIRAALREEDRPEDEMLHEGEEMWFYVPRRMTRVLAE